MIHTADPGACAPPTPDIASALADAKARYAASNPASRGAHLEAVGLMPGGNTRTVLHVDPFPLYFSQAEGSTLTDLDGHAYDDFLCEYTTGIYGHSHPLILSALQDATRAGMNFGGHNRHEAKLAALLTERFPALEMVRFTNSGTEANLLALGAARIFTGRDEIMVFAGAYHGSLLSFGRATSVNPPFDFVVATYNDLEGTRALLHSRREGLAAVIVEPMLQSGGCIPGDDDFLRMLRDETASCGALLIFDEVVTSRLAPGGVHAKVGLKPDLITLGKYIGGGMSFGAFGGRADIMGRFDPRSPDAISHSGTFNNNTLTMAAGYAGMAEIFTAEAAVALNVRGDALRGELNSMAAAVQAPMQFTGMGSVMAVHMSSAKLNSAEDALAGDMRLRDLFYFHLLEQGIYLAARGMFNLSLVTSEAQITRLVEGVASFLDRYRPLLASARSPA